VIVYCATTNAGKLGEFRLAAARFSRSLRVEAVPALGSIEPCPETGDTFEANAVQKALYFSRFAPGPLFADDSGLEVEALGGAPGVHSARFAGPGATDAENNRLLLERMRGRPDRTARFVCVIALTRQGRIWRTFRGAVEGVLLDAPRGAGGFGYDPLFFYPPYGRSLAEVTAGEKLRASHRGQALDQMFRFLVSSSE